MRSRLSPACFSNDPSAFFQAFVNVRVTVGASTFKYCQISVCVIEPNRFKQNKIEYCELYSPYAFNTSFTSLIDNLDF